ncbi:nucleolar protein, component of the U3 processome [Volvox africanus]|uniref:Nucleolar protein, component of the U3 processome n=1 Tax=Volvox africanus TaxID=51714 RepID=A0ABQ5S0D8_9CHLO|nr:nucleolar protein, component of the U3 processome [Volvox africanus]
MDFVFNNLLGAPYRGGTLLIHNNELLTPVGNRVGQVNLTESTSKCFPFENLTQIRTICVSPDGSLLVSIDKDGRALLISRKRNVLLHHFSFKGPVACAKFSPDGRYLAVGQVKLVQVWLSPSLEKQMSPMQLYRTYGQSHSDVLDLDWSPACRQGGDGGTGGEAGNHPMYFIAAGCRDGTVRVFSLDPIPGYDPPALGGHKEGVVGVFFSSGRMRAQVASATPGGVPESYDADATSILASPPLMYSISADGALFAWTYAVAGTAAAAAGVPYSNLAKHVAAKRRREDRLRQQQEVRDGGKRKKQRKGAESSKVDVKEEEEDEEEKDDQEEAAAKSGSRSKSCDVNQAGGDVVTAAAEGAGGCGTFPRLAGGKWYLAAKHYFSRPNAARVTSYAYHSPSGILALGFSTGVFELQQLVPEPTCLHTLSISRERITSLAFNHTGDWLAVGCARLGQLLVWEWRSETYVLKQQGHFHDITTTAFSPDGALIATGADDCKVKVFQLATGFCFVTFTEHTAPVTAVTFLPSGAVLLSASLDGTVRAWDLVRYRNFRTMTSPSPAQYGSLAVDPGGEVVVAGAIDTFQIFVWSLKTGRLLDVLTGHEGPVSGLSFSPITSLLASASWDRTVRTWDVYDSGGSGASEVLEHRHEVLAVAMRPDGRQLAAAAADGSIYIWDPIEGQLQGTIEGRRDIRGGRLQSDRRTAANSSAGAAFTSLAYSADGALLLAGGNSKYVCVYDVAERLLLRRFQLSHNRSLDGVLDNLNSKNMTDAGPLQLIDKDDNDDGVELLPPTIDVAASADVPGTSSGKRPLIRSRCIALSPTGRVWAAASTEGLLLYGTDDGLIFDPTDLTQDVTPAAVHSSLAASSYLRALLIALRLSDQELVRHVLLATPLASIQTTAAGLPPVLVAAVLGALAECAARSPHLEFVLAWIRTVCAAHGASLKSSATSSGGAAAITSSGALMPVLRSLQKVLGGLHSDLAAAAEGNMYTLEYMTAAAVSSKQDD